MTLGLYHKHQRLEQSGFTHGKSTTDRILMLRVILERRREFGRGLQLTSDLKKVFDTVHRESLWDFLRLRGIPTRTISKSVYCTCMDWILGRATVQSHCGAILGNIKVTDLDFVDDVAILSESLETLVVALDAFSNQAKSLDLEVWTKTKVQDFGDLLGEPVQPGSQHTDWPGSRCHELSQQEYLEMPVPVQKDQVTGFQGPDNANFAIR
ncbi:uncharacterized protein [Penaeus vannamei]|uniref:uncharacterized protein n=1 Tax=Penaeus vannamei TaxID=6689 RepID=UPI00387FA43E